MGQIFILAISFYSPFSLFFSRFKEGKLRPAMLWDQNIVRGQSGDFQSNFWSSQNILSLIVWNLQRKKEKQSSIYAVSNNSYVLISLIMSRNSTKKWKLISVWKGLLQAHHNKCSALVKLLCIYFCYLDLLNHG